LRSNDEGNEKWYKDGAEHLPIIVVKGRESHAYLTPTQASFPKGRIKAWVEFVHLHGTH
jgi:hypothetical protein